MAPEPSEGQEEFPPLWPEGFHILSLAEIRHKCVDAFSLSTTRKRLFDSFETAVRMLEAKSVKGNIWLDGEFVTTRINPAKIVFILEIEWEVYEKGDEALRAIVEALTDNTAEFPPQDCDTNLAVIFDWPSSDGNDVIGYWRDRFGFSLRQRIPMGIVIVPIPRE